MKTNFKNLEKKIKIKFNDSKLLTKCLTHKSYDSQTNNEKIEFLGDRVLGLVLLKNYLIFIQMRMKVFWTKNLHLL